ncbi:urease accessory protein UreD [Bradyrhizobium sp. ARR65]|uniref:urease accessory protein UreD n=1 Tax=Bradyrhizobium sp. ARR65 TaxID=1040989 RepID=UPI000467861B|nr:urease accessory protein UreD [Bradyrhizobium sp. ARR65]
MRSLLQSCSGSDTGRSVDAALVVERAGGRSVLRRQQIRYPLHITRGFYLDATRPDLLTLYLQSASGGLYAGDRIRLNVDVGRGAAFHLTTQAATVVHAGRNSGATQRQRVYVEPGGFCALTSDAYVLFPDADLTLETDAVVADDAVLCLADGFAVHDPRKSDREAGVRPFKARPFERFEGRLAVSRPDGRLLLKDLGAIDGNELHNGALGPWAAAANLLLIAPQARWPARQELEQAADRNGALGGCSVAPNGAGLILRILAPDGGTLARAMDAAFHVAAAAALGVALARRRK